MENIEIWKDIKDYEGLYQVSNLGRVKSLWFGKERIMKQGKDNYGYYCVGLYKDGKRKTFRVHRLVATAFLLNPNNYPFVNHKDENKQNNCASNLEHCTHQYNNNYGTRNERVSKSMIGKNINKNGKPILQFNKQGTKIIGKWESARQVERKLNIEHSNITNCLKGRLKSCGGYRWMYLEDYVNRMNKLYQLILKKAS